MFTYLDKLSQYPITFSSLSDHTSLKDVISTKSSNLTLSTIDSTTLPNEQNIHSTDTTSKNPDQIFSSIQSTLISHSQTSTITTSQTENNFSTIKSSTEILNITSASP